MARIWSGYADAERAAETIATVLRETGTVPEALASAYRETLSRSYRGVVQRFYETLAEKAPEALKYFA